MRLAVDARSIFRPDRRGIGNSLLALYRQVMAQHPDWEILAYHRDPRAEATALAGATLRYLECRGDRFDAWQQWRLPLAAWRDGADVLHCPANEAPRFSPVPTAVTIHDLIPLDAAGTSRRFRRGLRRACRSASAIICPSHYTRNDLLARFAPKTEKLHVVPWGAPRYTPKLTRARRQNILNHYGITEPFALHFGAADPRKNTLALIDAWAQVRQRLELPWQLVIAGLSASDTRSVMARAQSRGIASCVLPLTFLDQADVPPLLACAGFLAYPSSAEGFGLPILEAWAAGTAVLTGNRTSLPEVAGDAALLVDPRKPESLIEGLTTLMRDPDLRHRLVAAGRRRVKRFTWRKAACAFARIVQDVAGVRAAPAVRPSPAAASISLQTVPAAPVDVLVVSTNSLWPMDQGYRVHGPHLARALREAGLRVAVACLESASRPPAVLRDLLAFWPRAAENDIQTFSQASFKGLAGKLRRRLTQHLGPEISRLAGILPLVRQYQPRAVLGVGMLAPLLLQGIPADPGVKRIWYAADELVYFNLSCLKFDGLRPRPRRLGALLLHGVYERAFAGCLDGAIAASPLDQKLLRRLAGIPNVALIRNGVDLDYFAPGAREPTPRSLVFWGRLDFEPNVDALCWFARHVWPRLGNYRADATWQIIGKNPAPRVQALAQLPGVQLVGPVRDIRPYARRAAAVILPMRCGGGIKNKLLEAAALGRPIVASPHAVRGLEIDKLRRPVMLARTPDDWVMAVRRLWADSTTAGQLARRARAWVQANHSWSQAAAAFCDWLGLAPATPLPQRVQPTPVPLPIAERTAA